MEKETRRDGVELGAGLTGTRRVRIFRPAFNDVHRLCKRTTDKIEVRRHALKLRYWPEKHPADDSGQLLDLDWSWIRAMPGMKVGELRIHDDIGGNDNLRIIFFEGDPEVCEPVPFIWILQVLQKKRNEFTAANIATFRARRTLVVERFYKHRP